MVKSFGCTKLAGVLVDQTATPGVLIASSVKQLEVMAVDRLEVEQFNLRFLLAASHYLPSG
jgi:hypothetical protein